MRAVGAKAVGRSARPRLAALVALAAGAYVVLTLPIGFRMEPPGPWGPRSGLPLGAYRALVVVLAVVGTAAVLLASWRWLVSRPAATACPTPRLLWLRLAAPCWAVWSLYLLAFWPGLLSVDSSKQWEQLVSGTYTDAHPAFHTLTMGLITRVWFSPAAVALTQIAVIGALVGVVLAGLWRAGARRGAVVGSSLAAAVLPATGALSITLWKDVAYAAALLALGHLLTRTALSRGAWLRGRVAPIELAVAGAAAALFHHGGTIVVVGTFAVLAVAYRPAWRRLALSAALVGLAWVGVRGVLEPALDVSKDHPGAAQIYLHHIAAHLAEGAVPTDAEEDLLAEVLPTDWRYECANHNGVVQSRAPGRQARWHALRARSDELRSMAVRLFLDDPMVDVRHKRCNSELVWRIREEESAPTYKVAIESDSTRPVTEANLTTIARRARLLGVRREPVLDDLTVPLARLVLESTEPRFSWLFWRAPVAGLALLGAVAVAVARTGNRHLLLVPLPALLVTLVVLLAAPSQDFRYEFPVYLTAALVAAPLATLGTRPTAMSTAMSTAVSDDHELTS